MSNLGRLAPYLLRYRRDYAFGIAAAVAATLFSLFSPWVLQRAVDDLARSVTAGKLGAYGGILLGFACAGGLFRFLMRKLVIGASRYIEFDLRNDFFRHLQRLPLAFFQSRRTGDIMARAGSDLESVRLMVGIAMIDTANTIIVFVVAVLLMISIDPWLTLIALAPLPMVSVSAKYFGRAIHRRFQRVQSQLSELSVVVQQSLTGVRVVRAYNQENAEIARFREATRRYLNRNRSVIRVQSVFYAGMALWLGAGSLLVLWLGSREVMRGEITLGQFVAFSAYQMMLGLPMIAFGSVTNTIQRGVASWGRILDVLDAPAAEEAGRVSPASLTSPVRGDIEVRNLTFSFDGRTVLDDVSFALPAGRTLALVGPTGSGKSVLLSLLPRLHEPPRGTIFLDGVDVRDIPLSELRAAIGVVPQDPFLFSDTVAENIAFAGSGLEPANDEPERLAGGVDLRGAGAPHTTPNPMDAVRRAGAIARLDQDVDALPQGYDTPLGERGVTLSGGQRQRTALARAVMMAPKVLLLDDALAAVDVKTEEEILSGLRAQALGERTAIIVSNRISTVRDADLILILDRGRIVERGRHEELVARGGLYADLYRKQLLRDALAAS